MQQNVLAMVLAVLMVGAVAGPAVAAAPATAAAGNTGLAVDVAQDDGVTVTVTDNGTGVDNASVDVATVDSNASYNGTGSYETGPNGTVSLPSPTEHVKVSVTATVGNETATTTALLTAGENATYKNFGQSVSAFVAILEPADMTGPPGQIISDFVVSNNPSNSNETGPPEHAGPPEDDDEADSTETDGNETGPPEHAGPPEDRGNNGTDKANSGNGDNGNGNSGNGDNGNGNGNNGSDKGNNGNGNGKANGRN
jgi:hypothetical protein